MSKGGISIPPYLVITMIALVIVIAIAFLFLTNTGKAMIEAFKEISSRALQDIICGIIPVVGPALCGG